MEIEYEDLTNGQKNAVEGVIKMLTETPQDERKHIVIKGRAGCGKSLATKFIVDKLAALGIRGVLLSAPTHQAKNVLSEFTNREAFTIHSILRIKPETYEDTKEFGQSEIPKLDDCQVLVFDEGSMCDRKLFDILLASIPTRCLIVVIGDDEQIRSVDKFGNAMKSPFFRDPRFVQFELTEVMRAKGAILDLANKVRDGNWIGVLDVENTSSGEETVTVVEDSKALLKAYIRNVKSPADFINNRIIAYTNRAVDNCNRSIRNYYYGKDAKEFIKGEILVLQEPVVKKEKVKEPVTIFNNSEKVEIVKAEETSDFFGLHGVSGKPMIRYWKLTLKSAEKQPDFKTNTINDSMRSNNKPKEYPIRVITVEKEKEKLDKLLNDAATLYKDKSSGIKPAWSAFWDLKGKFTSVKYLPACTYHKSQGSSVDNAYVCVSEIDNSRYLSEEEKKELIYVGVSRPRKNLYLF